MHVHSHDYHDVRQTLNSTPGPSMWCYVPRIWVRRTRTSRECGQILEKPILGDPGAVSRVRRKGRTKVFITGERAPGYWLSPNHFQKFKQMLAPDKVQKMLCIILPNRRTHLKWVLFVCLYMTVIVSITACLAYAPKKCTQSGNFQFDIKAPSDPMRLLLILLSNASQLFWS